MTFAFVLINLILNRKKICAVLVLCYHFPLLNIIFIPDNDDQVMYVNVVVEIVDVKMEVDSVNLKVEVDNVDLKMEVDSVNLKVETMWT